MNRLAQALGPCLVFGGAGWTGKAVVRALRVAGVEAVTSADLHDHPGVPSHRCDIADGEAVGRIFDAVEPRTVFHLAAMIDIRPVPDPRIEAVNVGGTEHILRGARRVGARVVYTSTIDVVWGGPPMVSIDEQASYPARYPHEYARTKAAGERLVLGAHGQGLETIALRPGHVFGPGDDIIHFVGGVPLRFGPQAAEFSFVYVDNLAHAHVLAAARLAEAPGQVGGRPFFIADFDANFYDTYRRFAGRSPARIEVPKALLGWLTAGTDGVARFASRRLGVQLHGHPKRALSSAALQACQSSTIDASAARAELGYTAKVPPAVAIEATQAWARAEV